MKMDNYRHWPPRKPRRWFPPYETPRAYDTTGFDLVVFALTFAIAATLVAIFWR